MIGDGDCGEIGGMKIGYIPEDYILHSHRRENLKSYEAANSITFQYWATSVIGVVH
jgi:hypothetical protein